MGCGVLWQILLRSLATIGFTDRRSERAMSAHRPDDAAQDVSQRSCVHGGCTALHMCPCVQNGHKAALGCCCSCSRDTGMYVFKNQRVAKSSTLG